MAGQHRIHREHSNYWHLYPDFQKAVRRPLDEARHYKSFKHKFLQSVIKDDFDVKIGSSDTDGALSDGALFGPCTMESEGIVAKYSARLRHPHAFTGPDFKGMNAKAMQKQLQEADP
ncbi:MAG: hypothetical protein Q9185_004554 [Variospora sp. 1 TL-2023]